MNGPSNLAVKGSYVTIYFTGGGQTNPPGVTGSITGSTLKWPTQAISATVGNQPAAVSFDESAPTFVDGVDSSTSNSPRNTPSGAQPVANRHRRGFKPRICHFGDPVRIVICGPRP